MAKINWRWVAFWVTLFSVIYFWPTEGGEIKPIELKLSPQACLSPCEVRASLRIARHPDNRYAEIIWEYGSHGWTIDGENVPAEYPPITIFFRLVGEYDVYGTLFRIESGKQVAFQDKKRLIVAAKGVRYEGRMEEESLYATLPLRVLRASDQTLRLHNLVFYLVGQKALPP